jgi:hypothetical protein
LVTDAGGRAYSVEDQRQGLRRRETMRATTPMTIANAAIPPPRTAYPSIAGRPRKLGLTVTIEVDEDEIPFASVIVTVTAKVPVAEGVQVNVAPTGAEHPAGSPDQTYVYGAAPAEGVAVSVVD